MKGAVVFQMCVALLLGTVTWVGRAQVSTAKVMRGNIRRDGKSMTMISSCCVCACCCASVG